MEEFARLERELLAARAARAAASDALQYATRAAESARAAVTSAERSAAALRVRADEVFEATQKLAAEELANGGMGVCGGGGGGGGAQAAASVCEDADEGGGLDITAAALASRRRPERVGFTAHVSVDGDSDAPRAPLSRIVVSFRVETNGNVRDGDAAPEENDFVGVFPVGARDGAEEHFSLEFLDGESTGVKELRLPSIPGAYQVYYVHASGTLVACCPSPIRVEAVTAPLPLPSPRPAAPAYASASPPAPAPAPAPGPAAPMTMYESLAMKPHLVPPYLLEFQPLISVLQLYIPLPHGIVARVAAGSVHSAADARAIKLPREWTPGIVVEAARGSGRPAIVVALELPRLDGVPAYAATREAAAAAAAAVSNGTRVAALPRDLYLLRLPVLHKIEEGKVVMTVARDHVSLRLPLFYTGAAPPARPASLVSLEEATGLRTHGRSLACRACSAPLLAPAALGAPTSMRVHLLPSEHWTEWAELWMCHETQANVLLPRDDEGEVAAVRGAFLVGESVIHVHASDVGANALRVRAARVPPDDDGCDAHVRHGGHVHDDSTRVHPSTQLTNFDVECERCSSTLGMLAVSVGASRAVDVLRAACKGGDEAGVADTAASSARAFSLFLEDSEGGGAGGVGVCGSLFDTRGELPTRLSSARHPLLRLFKDRLSVPPGEPAPGTPPRPPLTSALELYSACSRVATSMLADALAHGQFWYVWTVDSTPRVLVGLLNWNTSIRAGAAGGVAGDSACALPPPWAQGGDLPTIKIRFRLLDAPLCARDEAAAREWGTADQAATIVRLSQHEAEQVLDVLAASVLLLPRGMRVVEDCTFGFLPFLAGPLKVV